MKKAFCIIAIALLLPACGGKTQNAANSETEPLGSAKLQDNLVKALNDHNYDRIRELVEKGADVNTKNESRITPLHLAVARCQFKLLEFLLAHSADANARDNAGRTSLHYLHTPRMRYGWSGEVEEIRKTAKLLLDKGADVSVSDNDGYTPLHLIVAEYGDCKLAKLYISKGANVNAVTKIGHTPLDYAVQHKKNERMADLLREHGGKLEHPFRIEIMAAARSDAIEQLRQLLASGANVDATDTSMNTPLHIAARYGSKEAVQYLLANGAAVNAANLSKEIPLHAAAENEHQDVIKVLLSEGSNVNAKDVYGNTPLDLARTEETKQLLRSHGGVSGKELKGEKDE